MELSVQCACGKVQGTISNVRPGNANVAICECTWCQRYAHALDRGDELLDENGGTTVLMISPARLRFTDGIDQIACGRMTSKGPLRWYAGCCNSPLANTLPYAASPFVAVQASCVEQPVADAAGGVRAIINTPRKGGKASAVSQGLMVARLGGLMGVWWLQGAHKKMPFPDVAPHRFARVEG